MLSGHQHLFLNSEENILKGKADLLVTLICIGVLPIPSGHQPLSNKIYYTL